MEICIAILFICIILLIANRSGLRLWGMNAHPLAFLIWMQIILLTIIGVLGIGLYDWEMSYGSGNTVSGITRIKVVWLVLSSTLVLFFGLLLLFKFKVFKPLIYQVNQEDIALIGKLTVISIAILLAKLLLTDELPLNMLLKGDLLAAARAKTNILTKQTGITLFGFNYVARSFVSYVYIASLLLYSSFEKSSPARNIFIVNIILIIIDSLYDLQKQGLVLIFLTSCWLLYIKKGSTKILVFGVGGALALSTLLFSMTIDAGDQFDFLKAAVTRILSGQAEGAFYILENITPSVKYIWLGMPLAKYFGFEQIDPAAEVVQIVFPGVSEDWINSNTYYIAHAWSIFGWWAVVIGPIFILLNLVIMLTIAQKMSKKKYLVYYAISFWLIIKMPIVNIFTEFLWLKVALDYCINIVFLYICVGIFSKKNSRIRKNFEILN